MLIFVAFFTCFLPVTVTFAESESSRPVVAWISIDGIRPDYIARSETPFFDRMMAEGAYSLEHEVIFPSLTFPSHVSQATGVTVGQHGIPMNSFYDRALQREFSFPGQSFLLEAEPIWVTAERQGRRAAVYDWVLSYGAFDDVSPDIQGRGYAGYLDDHGRLQQVIDAWQNDQPDPAPLQLLMGYMDNPDQIGHRFGPDSPEIEASMALMDQYIAEFAEEALRLFHKTKADGDEFYLLITSDHGMSKVHTAVNPYALADVDREEANSDRMMLVTSGNIAHVYVLDPHPDRQQAEVDRIYAAASAHDWVDVYRRDSLPERWGYDHPQRVGDIVMVLQKGYTFNRGTPGIKAPRDQVGGHIGMHGYDPKDNPEMTAIMLVWRYPTPLGGVDLGPVHSLQLHATVADWLGIEPAEGADPRAIRLP